MTDSPGDIGFQRLMERIEPGSRLLRSRSLTGGVSAQTTVRKIERSDGSVRRVVVRRHGLEDLAQNPRSAADEYRLLEIAHSYGLKAPRPYYVDESRTLFPTPVIVLKYVQGETDFAPADLSNYTQQAAEELVRIHRVIDPAELAFLTPLGCGYGDRPGTLDKSLGEGRIRDALEGAWPLPSTNEPVLIHGDYWPGNLLWKDGQLVAVVDWEDARVGDPLADLGNSRLEFLFFFGFEAMEEFTQRYLSMMRVDPAHLPYWDLRAALRPCSKLSEWGLDPTVEQQIRERHRTFVDQALQLLRYHEERAMK